MFTITRDLQPSADMQTIVSGEGVRGASGGGVRTFEMPSSKCHKPRRDEVVGILAGTADEVFF